MRSKGSVLRADITSRYRLGLLKLIGAILAVLLLVCFVGVSRAHAQTTDRESVTLSPTSNHYTVDAGGAVNGKLTIVNDGKTAYDFTVYARPYSIKNNEYAKPDFTNATKSSNLYAWVRFPQAKYHAAANTTTEIKYSIDVPDTASPGGHYGVIFVEVQPSQQNAQGNSVLRKKRVGSIVYATVKGDVKLIGDIAPGGGIPFWQVQPPLHTTVSAKNTGNTHFIDKATLTVSDVFGNVKYRSQKDIVVLPGTTRVTDMDWSRAAWFGLYKASTEQSFLGKSFKSEGYVLIMPRYVPFVLLIVIIAGGVYAVVRRRKK